MAPFGLDESPRRHWIVDDRLLGQHRISAAGEHCGEKLRSMIGIGEDEEAIGTLRAIDDVHVPDHVVANALAAVRRA